MQKSIRVAQVCKQQLTDRANLLQECLDEQYLAHEHHRQHRRFEPNSVSQ